MIAALVVAALAQAAQPVPPAQPIPVPVVIVPSSRLPTTVDPDGMDLSIATGASVSNAGATNQTSPFVDVVANFPVLTTAKARSFRLELEGLFQGSPGQNAVNLQDISSFSAVTFNVGLHYVLGDRVSVAAGDPGARATGYASGGVQSRFAPVLVASTGNIPANKNPAHFEIGIEFAKKDHSASFCFSPVGFSSETGDPATVGRADGRVTIRNALRLQVSVIYPYANAPSNAYQVNTVHNVLTTVALSLDLDHIFASGK